MFYHFFLALAYIYGGLSLLGIWGMDKENLKDVAFTTWLVILCSWAFVIASWMR